MPGLFDRPRPDGAAVRRIKAHVAERFNLPETTSLAVAELRCHEPDCPPVETVITARHVDGSLLDWRIAKPISDVEATDVDALVPAP
ncbi:MAG: hypothetical protein AAGA32_15010 [Pseudomonadota bacterium]